MNVQVLDFNDCPPEFIEPPTSYSIDENSAIGSVLVDFDVSDCDDGLNGVNGSRFSIIAGTWGQQLQYKIIANIIIMHCRQ